MSPAELRHAGTVAVPHPEDSDRIDYFDVWNVPGVDTWHVVAVSPDGAQVLSVLPWDQPASGTWYADRTASGVLYVSTGLSWSLIIDWLHDAVEQADDNNDCRAPELRALRVALVRWRRAYDDEEVTS